MNCTVLKIILKSNIDFLLFLILFINLSCRQKITDEKDFVIYITNPQKQNVRFYWKGNNGAFKNIESLKKRLESENQNLLFAMNGGMFENDNSPKGLYIENSKILKNIDTLTGNGNFYLQPNGIFYLTKSGESNIIETKKYKQTPQTIFATQSGPMLLIDGGEINPIFQRESNNLNIRNGVGILQNGELIFAMSKAEINFYNFAKLFKEYGCKKALYLDGFVSRVYAPSKKREQIDGDFGVIIGISESKK